MIQNRENIALRLASFLLLGIYNRYDKMQLLFLHNYIMIAFNLSFKKLNS